MIGRRPPDDWLERERRSRSVGRELARLLRRARRRPGRVALLAAVAASLLLVKISHQPQMHSARVLLRVTEGELSEDRSPLPRGQLRDYVWSVAFSRQQLLPLIEELDLYPRRAAFGDDWALAMLRDAITVDAYRNYFAVHRGYSTAPRTARIAIYFEHLDRDVAFEVARRLAQLIRERESELRQQASGRAAEQARLAVERARQGIAERQAELTAILFGMAAAETGGDEAEAATLRYEMTQVFDTIEAERENLQEARAMARSLDLQRELDARQMGLSFQVVDERRPELDLRHWLDLVVIGVAAFFALLPLSVLTIGAFDARIRDRADVRRLGLDVLGHVPDFPGAGFGSLAHRRRGGRGAGNRRRGRASIP